MRSWCFETVVPSPVQPFPALKTFSSLILVTSPAPSVRIVPPLPARTVAGKIDSFK